jgi:hypothetical protein
MLAKIAPRFVIKGVIQTSYYANFMSIELTKQILGDSAGTFYLEDAKKYFVSVEIFRNAISMDFLQLILNPLSSSINSKLKSINKLWKNCLFTTVSASCMKS